MNDSESKRLVPTELIDYAKSLFDRHIQDFDTANTRAGGIIAVLSILVGFQALNAESLVYLLQVMTKGPGVPVLVMMAFLTLLGFGAAAVSAAFYALRIIWVKPVSYPSRVMDLVERYRDRGDQASAPDALRVDITRSFAQAIDNVSAANLEKAQNFKKSIAWMCVAVSLAVVYTCLFALAKAGA